MQRDTPVVPDEFLYLKHLAISFVAWSSGFCLDYDYLSLVSFLEACPALETFTLSVSDVHLVESVNEPLFQAYIISYSHGYYWH
jgi:hypothetical protein